MIKPYAKIDRDCDKADIYVDGPIEEILIADFNFTKDIVRVYGSIKPLMLTQLGIMFNDIKREVGRELKERNSSS
jgi:hypothetical protein